MGPEVVRSLEQGKNPLAELVINNLNYLCGLDHFGWLLKFMFLRAHAHQWHCINNKAL